MVSCDVVLSVVLSMWSVEIGEECGYQGLLDLEAFSGRVDGWDRG